MDWNDDLSSDLWAFPAGTKRVSNDLTWTSKYGSVQVAGYNAGYADGMNSEGLVGNLLYLAEADWGKKNGRPSLSIILWVTYVLDNFATVAEAVQYFSSDPLHIYAPVLPNGRPASMHLSISDATGDSAILEGVDGKMKIHHSKDYTVMTNSPVFEQQLALTTYWDEVPGFQFVPGSIRAADRFIRGNHYLEKIPRVKVDRLITAVIDQKPEHQFEASLLGAIRAIGVPLGMSDPEKPNLSSTLWRTLSNHKQRRYFFESATTPNLFWVELKDLNLGKSGKIMKLPCAGGKIYAGNAASKFVEATPFVPMGTNAKDEL
jgi:penicillin V acylase-like amidase (Ntn superfamily)